MSLIDWDDIECNDWWHLNIIWNTCLIEWYAVYVDDKMNDQYNAQNNWFCDLI